MVNVAMATEDKIRHYQRGIDRALDDKPRLLHCIEMLAKLPVTVNHLQLTGVGRTVNSLRKVEEGVGDAAKQLVNKWKTMVANHVDTSTDEDEACVPDVPDCYESPDCDSEPEHQISQREIIANLNQPEAFRSTLDIALPLVVDTDNIPAVPSSSTEHREGHSDEEPLNENLPNKSSSSRHLSSSSEHSTNKSKQTKKDSESKSSSKDKSSNSYSSHSKSSHSLEVSDHKKKNKNKSESSSSRKDKKHSEDRKRKYESSSSDRESDKKKKRISESEDEEHEDEQDVDEEENLSIQDERSGEDVIDEEEECKDTRKEKSKDKHHSSSSKHSKSKSHESREKSKKDKKSSKSDGRGKEENGKSEEQHSKESSKSKSSHSSSSSKDHSKDKDKDKHSKDKSKESSSKSHKDDKDRSSKKEIKDDRGKSKEQEKKDKERKESKHHKEHKEDKEQKEQNEQKDHKEKRKLKITDGIDCNSGTSFADALGMCTIPPPKKKKEGSSKSSKDSPTFNSSSSSSSSFNKSSSSKSSIKVKSNPPDCPEPLSLLSSNVKLDPLNRLDEEVDLALTLPEPSPYYKPLPHINHAQRRQDEDEMLSQVIYAKNQRTKVYSGNKTIANTTVPNLTDMCIRVLIDNIDALEFTGGVPYFIIKPVLERATADQLFMLEHHNPYLIEESDALWQFHCNKDFRSHKREEMESWREMYMRCLDEREAKLKALTANIKQSIDKSQPVRSTKLAYVDNIVKPPRSVLRKQAKYGTANSSTSASDLKKKLITGISGNSGTSSNASSTVRISVPPPPIARSRHPSSSTAKKAKAPLMAKALQAIKGRYKR